MKYYIVVLTLIMTCGFSNAQSTLQVNIRDCRLESSFDYLGEFTVFKNDTLLATIEPRYKSIQTLKNLEYGSYRIEYTTIFNNKEAVTIELSERKKYSIDLCLDYLDFDSDSYIPFIDRLKDGESYSIQFSSQGCFHSTEEQIEVMRKDNNFYLNQEGEVKPLNSKLVELIRHFEIELNYMGPLRCTTTDYYVLNYKENEVRIADGGCRWNGYHHLMGNLSETPSDSSGR